MRTVTVLLGIALFGCSDPMNEVSLDFRAEPLEVEELSEWSVARLESGYHRITVRRATDVTLDCDELGAVILRTGRDLTLRVTDSGNGSRTRHSRTCGYTAVIKRIPPGQYKLRVVHSSTSRSGARVVMDQPLHIR